MTDDWKPYICNVNGSLASIAVNLGLRESVRGGWKSGASEKIAKMGLVTAGVAGALWRRKNDASRTV
jgi:hypothetical protein